MEYGINAQLPIYSGGLGVLAGDIVKAASDQNRDFIAIGMLWGEVILSKISTAKAVKCLAIFKRPAHS